MAQRPLRHNPHVISCLVMALSLLGQWGCGSKGPAYPEDHQRFVRIDGAIEGLRRAYVEHDLDDFRGYLLPGSDAERLEAPVEKDLQTFRHITLDLSVERILINQDVVDVYIHWNGQWRREPADPPIRERGHGRLQFVGEQSVLLTSGDGVLPFGLSGRAPALPDNVSRPGGS